MSEFPFKTHRRLLVGEVTESGDRFRETIQSEWQDAPIGHTVGVNLRDFRQFVRPHDGKKPGLVEILRAASLLDGLGDTVYEIENALCSDTTMLRSYRGKILKAPVADDCLPYCLVCGVARDPDYIDPDDIPGEAKIHGVTIDDVHRDEDGEPFIAHGVIRHDPECWVGIWMSKLFEMADLFSSWQEHYPKIREMLNKEEAARWREKEAGG